MKQQVDGSGVPDVCLGLIPGVSHACCGHGATDDAYVCLGGQPNQPATEFRHLTLRGQAAITFFNLLRLGRIEDAADPGADGPSSATPPQSGEAPPSQASLTDDIRRIVREELGKATSRRVKMIPGVSRP